MKQHASARTSAIQLSPEERRAWLALEHVGPATVRDLELLGVRRLADLARTDAQSLYDRLCRLTNCRQDPCVLDVFSMLTSQARGEPARPWWEFSRERIAEAGGARARRESATGAQPRARGRSGARSTARATGASAARRRPAKQVSARAARASGS